MVARQCFCRERRSAIEIDSHSPSIRRQGFGATIHPGDWVEITDDRSEFSLEAGEIRQIDSVNDSSRTITLKSALTAGLFPVNAQDLTDPERHTRIKRWDQDPADRRSSRCLPPVRRLF